MTLEEKRELLDSVKFWWHKMDLGDGLITPGLSDVSHYVDYLPDLVGKSVLDIGAWDGAMSFEAERRGAKQVIALDRPVWIDPRFGYDGFDVAKTILGSSVTPWFADIEEIHAEVIGEHDVVFFFGVLYHLKSPYPVIEKLYAITKEVVCVETQSICVPGHQDRALLEFYDDDLNNDDSNWFAPNDVALEKMFKAVGFKKIDFIRNDTTPQGRIACLVWK